MNLIKSNFFQDASHILFYSNGQDFRMYPLLKRHILFYINIIFCFIEVNNADCRPFKKKLAEHFQGASSPETSQFFQ